MRDFVEKSEKFSDEGGPDFPFLCTKTTDEKGPLSVYGKTKEDCQEAKNKLIEIRQAEQGPTDVFDKSSSPDLMYIAIGLAAVAVVLIAIGLIINVKSKAKKENE